MSRPRPRKRKRDPRVTSPMISWQVMLTILVIVLLLITGQSFIFKYFLDHLPILVGIMSNYTLWIGAFLIILVWLVWRRYIGKPIRKIAIAAQKVAAGDFSVRVDTKAKSKRKNEIDVLIEDFNTMIRELEGNEILKSDFIANVSHEIKTPLSIIQSYTKALKEEDLPPAQREQYIDTILQSTDKLNDMISNVLKLSKLENQHIFPVPETYQLGEQLRRCALNYMERWEAKDIDFAIDVADVSVHYDASLMELVWNNLLTNAIKFTETGGKIWLTSRVQDGSVVVTVRDTGCGMDEATQQRIFEKFYQGDPSHAVPGNGLGLTLAKRVIDIAGGTITVKSAPGEGSTFTVTLPLERRFISH